jgi:hypothetical protein
MILFRSHSPQGARSPLNVLYHLSRGALQLLTFVTTLFVARWILRRHRA